MEFFCHSSYRVIEILECVIVDKKPVKSLISDLAETVSITQRHTTLSVSSLFIERDIQRFCSNKETCGTHTYLQSSSASSPSSPRTKKTIFLILYRIFCFVHHQEMGKRDEKAEAVLRLLRKQTPLTLKQEKFCNRDCVERFLKGKGDNVKKAAKQLTSCLSWRQNFDIERIGAEEFSAELADGVAYIAGHDGESRPVIMFRFKHDYQKLRSQKQFTRLVAFTMETAISSMSRNAEQSVVLLFDASFFRSSSAFANLLLATLKMIADNYPCRLHKAFIIDPPSFFSYIWKGVRPFVELSTVTMLISSLDYDEQLDISHVSSSSCLRSASLRFDPSSIKSTAKIGSASSRFAFTVSHNSMKPWYLSLTDTSPFHAAVDSTASKVSPLSVRSLSFASPAGRGLRDPKPAACRKSLFPSTPLPEKTKTVPHRKTPRPSFFQSPAMFFRGEKNVGGGEKSSREAFVPYLKFYRRPYDETAYRSKLRGPRGFVSVVSSHRRCRHVSLSQRF
ncbi:unnamed protein product [Brassica rapa]|uniref:CRAL-TRIO domain-containing protein n=3 Tax=Brassica TaxID=3705 RepID=A0A3P5YVJ5_BRACM|nr:unnamed protein product [Brassica napus]CAG7876684.1 unnamed protein product [Brassica rapa]VDC71797.1 unnamed protein product [Brassica rapa]